MVALLAAGCGPAPAALRAEARCEPEHGLRQLCTVRLLQGGRPLSDATVRLTADMPSMPLAHHVPPAVCVPGNETGSYVARVDFEMPGRWMLGIRITGPRSDYLTHAVDVR